VPIPVGKGAWLSWGAEGSCSDGLDGFKAGRALTVLDFFVINSLECPLGWYGLNCQQPCACEHTCPCNRETGSCNITQELAIQDQLNKGTSGCGFFF